MIKKTIINKKTILHYFNHLLLDLCVLRFF